MPGIQIITRASLAESETTGMSRLEAVTEGGEYVVALRTQPAVTSGWHHHGDYRTLGYVFAGRLRLESGPGGRTIDEAGPGEFFVVPAHSVHRESNPSDDEQVVVGIRIGTGPTVVNVDGPEPLRTP